jgi:hypothetical protein
MPKRIVGVEIRYKKKNKPAMMFYLALALVSMLGLTTLFIFYPEVFGLQGVETVILRDDTSYLTGSCKSSKTNPGGVYIRLKTYPHTFYHPYKQGLKCRELLSNNPHSLAIEVPKERLNFKRPIKVISIKGKNMVYLEPSIFKDSSGPYQLIFMLLISAFLLVSTILTIMKSKSK